ncbi:MAG: hypothetical protein OHK0039_14610 [Bacteroidia bacterium]
MTLLLSFGVALRGVAQDMKIGYANIELILLYMPETKTMNQQLQTYEKKLVEELQAREGYLQTLITEYEDLAKNGSDETTLRAKQDEVMKLQQSIREKSQDSQQKLMTKRQDLLEPIIEKLQAEITALAQAEGYAYIFNTVDGSGVSILLHGPEQHDLTKKLMTRLGIQIPEENAGN